MKFSEAVFEEVLEIAVKDAEAKLKKEGLKLKPLERRLLKVGAAAGISHTIAESLKWVEKNKGFCE